MLPGFTSSQGLIIPDNPLSSLLNSPQTTYHGMLRVFNKALPVSRDQCDDSPAATAVPLVPIQQVSHTHRHYAVSLGRSLTQAYPLLQCWPICTADLLSTLPGLRLPVTYSSLRSAPTSQPAPATLTDHRHRFLPPTPPRLRGRRGRCACTPGNAPDR